jgi:hypothetical protein
MLVSLGSFRSYQVRLDYVRHILYWIRPIALRIFIHLQKFTAVNLVNLQLQIY